MTHWLPLLLLFVGGSVLTIGDIVMKKWVQTNAWNVFIGGLAIYLVGLIFCDLSYKYKNVAVASTIFVIFNVITLSIVSWVYFKEPLVPLQLVGIALGIGAILCMEFA